MISSPYTLNMKLYIADCHFFHQSLLNSMDMRPFTSVEEMNETMIERWNSKVKTHDEVYILGDFSMGSVEESEKILMRLKGKLTLIVGNHDSFAKKKSFKAERFRKITSYLETSDNGRNVILCHYPILFYNKQFSTDSEGNSKTFMLYGHVHDTFDEKLLNRFICEGKQEKRIMKDGEVKTTPFNLINCFSMFSNYTPLSLDEWIEFDKKRRSLL